MGGGEGSLDMQMRPGPWWGKSRLTTQLGSLCLCSCPRLHRPCQLLQTTMVMATSGDELSVPWVTEKKDTEDTICLLTSSL